MSSGRHRASDARSAPRQRVLATVDAIPAGRVATYGQVARAAGLPKHARWVGRILGELDGDSALPWHRVLRADGAIALRAGTGAREQVRRLRREGVEVRGTPPRVDVERFRWSP